MSLPGYAMNQQSFPEMYERWLAGPLFRPWAELTLREMKVTPGEAGHVVGVDISRDMLAVARKVGPGIEWREGNASALPLRDGERFDVVACQQGLQFFPEKGPCRGRDKVDAGAGWKIGGRHLAFR